ncbi:hypothetical protein ACFOOM_04630 [Streptomyces echinoruber]|uniref:Uncharacterized protein n=1 Tax=Streptomyces echinoruber TaxID=68898 RepID=A0A918S046_9ACTN|nr:hypothetical protein [Streptomyces echinoruber]GHA18984.1 hypothetical protein GCM10010389_66060 [Streptomyces echinoruber]
MLVADASVKPVPAARYRFRALAGRLAGTTSVPYLSILRAMEGAEQALTDKDVKAAAEKLRHQMEEK